MDAVVAIPVGPDAGCERVFLWPLGDEPRQIELVAGQVLPAVSS
jgi:hypothetical protein